MVAKDYNLGPQGPNLDINATNSLHKATKSLHLTQVGGFEALYM